MRKTKHIKLFEEIGFDYSTKQTPATEDEQPSDVIKPFSIDSLEGTFKRLSKIAFEAGRNTKITFDDFWAQTWNTGQGQVKKGKATLAKEPIGFKRTDTAAAPIENMADIIEDRPRRIAPKRIPKRPGPQRRAPGRPGRPEEEPIKIPGRPRRKGIWFEENE